MKTFHQILTESFKAGNFYQHADGKIVKVEKIADGKVHLEGGDKVARKGLVWTGKKKDGQAIWKASGKALDTGGLGKIGKRMISAT